jgi:hypothetical protein
MAAAIEKVTASAMISHTAPVTRLRLGSMIHSSRLRSVGATELVMRFRYVVT